MKMFSAVAKGASKFSIQMKCCMKRALKIAFSPYLELIYNETARESCNAYEEATVRCFSSMLKTPETSSGSIGNSCSIASMGNVLVSYFNLKLNVSESRALEHMCYLTGHFKVFARRVSYNRTWKGQSVTVSVTNVHAFLNPFAFGFQGI